MRWMWGYAALALGLVACSGEASQAKLTEIVLVVDTDLALPQRADMLRVVVTGPDGRADTIDAALDGVSATSMPATLGILHGGGPLSPIEIEAHLRRGEDEVVASRVRTSFAAGRSLRLQIDLLEQCVGMTCDDGFSCRAAGCMPTEVAPNTLPQWDGTEPPTRIPGGGGAGGVANDGGTAGASGSAGAVDLPDASADAGADSGMDGSVDASADSGTDAGADSGTDAGADSGRDAGPCTDEDGDGYCADNDCDDGIATCHVDCTTNSDAAGEANPVVDCLEVFCGSAPDVGASVCSVVTSGQALIDAFTDANTTAGHEHILLASDVQLAAALPAVTGSDGLTLGARGGVTLTYSGPSAELLVLAGDHSLVHGFAIEGMAATTVVSITGNDNTVLDMHLSGAGTARRVVYVFGGQRARVENNVITGATSAPGADGAGIDLRDATDCVVAGNIVAANASDGIRLRGTSGVYLDHNSVAGNTEDGVDFYQGASTNVCMRNNLVASNGSAALRWSVGGHTWSTASACTAALAAGPVWGNGAYGNQAACAGACAACACQPSGLFWPFSMDPAFLSSDVNAAEAYCPSSASLIDAVRTLGYDRNGTSSGNFAGTGPEPGAREAAALGCP